MSSDDLEQTLRERLRGAIDPMVPGPEVTDRVMGAVAGAASTDRRGGAAGSRIGRGLGTLLVASLVVVLVGGALGISLALRGRTIPTAPSSHTGPPATVPTPTPTIAPPSPSATPSRGLTACRSADLKARFADQNGAAGTQGGDIVLENVGTAPCTMDGYTNLQGVARGHATQLGVTHNFSGIFSNNGRPPVPRLVNLAPGHNAYVAVVYSDVQSTPKACPSYTTLLITLPNGGGAVLMAQPASAYTTFMLCSSVAAAIWIDEAPVSSIAYFARYP
jgi:Protein of unknown function (DUF4232)